jgi:predicted Zn-dependent protease
MTLETAKSSSFINDLSITAFVERVAQNLERNSDKHLPITIHLIDSETLNPRGTPKSGHIGSAENRP